MELVSVNVGLPRLAQFQGETVRTGIFKQAVSGPVPLTRTNLQGDQQADLAAHGGVDKAVYAYPFEHYDYWQLELQQKLPDMGSFGENFTVCGMLENEICIGDTFEVGTAVVQVSQPRTPCLKLAVRLQRAELPREFLRSLRSGFYLRVLQEGHVASGDRFTLTNRDPVLITVRQMIHVYHFDRKNRDAARNALENRSLAAAWRDELEKRVGTLPD